MPRLRNTLPQVLLGLLAVSQSQADGNVPQDHHPRACVGYSESNAIWGWKWMSQVWLESVCDANSAVYELDNPSLIRPHWFNCCPLPAPDILENEHLWAEESCPENYVVTGLGPARLPNYLRKFRCTKINSRRYELLPSHPGVGWGYGTSKILLPEGEKLRKSEIPDAIASSFGRKSLGEWDQNGCTSTAFGALLTGVDGDSCAATRFQALTFKGVDSDPPHGYPVLMFPPCKRIADVFDPRTGCIQNGLTPNHSNHSQTDYGETQKNSHR